MLEIGSAFGFFLEVARERFETVRGFDFSVEGTEFARARGLDVSDQDFLSLPLSGPRPDVVCLWDVLEHLREPRLYLEKCVGCLSLRAGVPFLHRGLRRLGLLGWDLYLNLFDIMYVVARKR